TPAQRALDRRQGDVHDRSVEQRDPRADDRGDKRQALERCVAAGGHTLTNGSPSRKGPARRRTAAAKRGGEPCQQRTFDRYTVVPSDEVCRRTSSIKILISASPRPCSAAASELVAGSSSGAVNVPQSRTAHVKRSASAVMVTRMNPCSSGRPC